MDTIRIERGRHEAAAGARDYRVAVPAAPATGPRPMLVVLHGCLQDADDIARGTRFDALAAHGCVVLYPQQDEAANARKCWNWFDTAHQTRGAGEPAILADLMAHVSAMYGVDASAVHVTGVSAGAAMATLLVVAYPELAASLTLASGVPWRGATNVTQALGIMQRGCEGDLPSAEQMIAAMGAHPRAIPVTIVHGIADAVVSVRNADELARQFVGVHDALRAVASQPPLVVRDLPRRDEGGRAVDERQWRSLDGAAAVTLVRIHDLGHAWSGGDTSGSFTDPLGPDISTRIMAALRADWTARIANAPHNVR